MARPPIIISNGGIASELIKNLRPAANEKRTALQIIVDNVTELNARINGSNPKNNPRPLARRLRGFDRNNDPRIYWRLENEPGHSRETGSDAQ